MGDRGVLDPVVSFDRGLAYAARVRAGSEQPGDLGRAAQGFEEARELTSDAALTRDATAALGLVRAEVARRRAQSGDPVEVEQGLPLGRAVTRLASDDAWGVSALTAALVLGIALFVRWLATARRARLGAAIALSVSAPALAVCALLALAARDERLHLREGIVVAPSVRIADDRHVVLDGTPPLAEGLRVTVDDSAAGWSKVRWGKSVGWVPSPAVRPIAKVE
jgi:hypothetical protein